VNNIITVEGPGVEGGGNTFIENTSIHRRADTENSDAVICGSTNRQTDHCLVNDQDVNVERYWFKASTPFGDILLGALPDNDGRNQAQEGALISSICALQQVEPLIQWLEDWFELPLEVHPDGTPALVGNVSLSITMLNHEKASSGNGLLIYIPFNALYQLNKPSVEMLTCVDVQWQSLPCLFNLSDVTILAEKLPELLETGSLLLIPNSFNEKWWCNVTTIANEYLPQASFMAELNSSQWSLQFRPIEIKPFKKINAVHNLEKSVSLNIEFEVVIDVSIDLLIGWSTEQCLLVDSQVSLQSLPALLVKQNTRSIAQGHLLPVGDGFGVFINSVAE